MRKYTRPFFVLLLVVLIAVGMMPFGAFATDTGTDPAEVIEGPIEPEVPLSEEPTEHDVTDPVEESEIEVPEEIQLATRYTAGSNITVYNYTVQSVRTADPGKTDELTIQEGRDLLTIFTCSYPNSKRVIVTCERSGTT